MRIVGDAARGGRIPGATQDACVRASVFRKLQEQENRS